MPLYRCGRCRPCLAGDYNICQQVGFHGLMSDGGMAEYTVVPTDGLPIARRANSVLARCYPSVTDSLEMAFTEK